MHRLRSCGGGQWGGRFDRTARSRSAVPTAGRCLPRLKSAGGRPLHWRSERTLPGVPTHPTNRLSNGHPARRLPESGPLRTARSSSFEIHEVDIASRVFANRCGPPFSRPSGGIVSGTIATSVIEILPFLEMANSHAEERPFRSERPRSCRSIGLGTPHSILAKAPIKGLTKDALWLHQIPHILWTPRASDEALWVAALRLR